MARTLTQLRTLLGQLAAVDPYDNMAGESPTSSDYNSQLNWAYREISRKLKLFNPSITMTLVAGTQNYDLRSASFSEKIVRVYGVYINNNPLYEASGNRRGLWKFAELEHQFPGWRTATNSTPFVAVQTNVTNLMLYPPPSSGVVSTGNNYVAATYLPADMSDDSDVPEIPEELHECIAYLAHVRAHMPTSTEEEQWKRLTEYSSSWQTQVAEIAKEQENTLQTWGSMATLSQGDYIFA